MTNPSNDNSGMLATIMGIGIFGGILAWAFMAFVLKMPAFQSAPIMMSIWLAALILVKILAPRRR